MGAEGFGWIYENDAGLGFGHDGVCAVEVSVVSGCTFDLG